MHAVLVLSAQRPLAPIFEATNTMPTCRLRRHSARTLCHTAVALAIYSRLTAADRGAVSETQPLCPPLPINSGSAPRQFTAKALSRTLD
jgi:hypothetical protein